MYTEENLVNGRPSWSAILLGAFSALGIALFLIAFGFAIFFSVENRAPHAAADWLAVWSLIVPIVSVFCGALVCARFRGTPNRGAGALQGIGVWGFSYVIGIALVALCSAPLMSFAGNLVGARAGKGMPLLNEPAVTATSALGINAGNIIAPVNRDLAAQGKATLDRNQAQTALDDSIANSMHANQVDRNDFISHFTQDTNVSRGTAEEVYASLGPARGGSDRAQLVNAKEGAVDSIAIYSWFAFVSMGLSLLGAVIAASLREEDVDRIFVRRREVVTRRTEVVP
jgi:hypothetical protein